MLLDLREVERGDAGCSPASARSRLSVASSAIARRVSCVAEPMCGNGVTLGCVRSGDSSGSGSTANTSRPAARRWPLSSASSSAASCTIAPREPLTKIAPGFIGANCARVHQAARFVGQRQGQRDDVGARAAPRRAARAWRGRRGRARCTSNGLWIQHRHAEAERGAPRHRLADAAEAEHAERLAVHVPAEQVFADVARPAAVAHVVRQLDEAPRRGHHEREHGVGGGLGQHAGRVAQHDAALLQRGEIVVVDADRDAGDHLQLRRLRQHGRRRA